MHTVNCIHFHCVCMHMLGYKPVVLFKYLFQLSVHFLSRLQLLLHPMLPTKERYLFESPFPCPTPFPFLLFCYMPVFFWEGLFLSPYNLGQSGSGSVAVVGQQSPLRHCIRYWSVQINLAWLVCSYIIVAKTMCVWIRVVLSVRCLSARPVVFPWFAIICSPLCLLKRSPGIYHEVLIAM